MLPFTFRSATPADLNAVIDLVTSAYRGESSRAGWTTEADFLEGNRIDPEILCDDMLRPRSRVLLAESTAPRQLLACAHIAEDEGAGYFGMFAVLPTLQGGGIGTMAMRVSACRCAPICALKLWKNLWGMQYE